MRTVSSIRVAIIGCGAHGAQCAALLGEARLVATCDRNPRRAAALASTAHACFPTNELQEALSFLPDAVIVATPLRSLPDIVMQSIRSGSHVFIDPGEEIVRAELDSVLAVAQAKRKLITVSSPELEPALAGFLRKLREVLHD